MGKTLSESAAEILKASMMSVGREPMLSTGASVQDLGGATPTDDYSGGPGYGPSVGANASAAAAVAQKPGAPGVPAEPYGTVSGDDDSEEEAEMEDDADESLEFKKILKPGEKLGAMDLKESPKNATPEHSSAALKPAEVREETEVEQIDGAYDANTHAKEIHRRVTNPRNRDRINTDREIVRAYKAGRGGRDFPLFSSDIEKIPGYSHVDSANGGNPKVSRIEKGLLAAHNAGKKSLREEVEHEEENISEAMKKKLVNKYRGSMREDVDALFNGESLSEDFRVKATLIFESAVQSRVEKIVEEVVSENDLILENAIEEIKSELSSQVDEYISYVAEEWVKENEVAIEVGLRNELSEDFIAGLKNLFNEHYIEIPDEKVDVAEELAMKVVELEEAVEAAMSENAALNEQVNKVKKAEAIVRACEGLTIMQAAKMKSLAESVEFTAEGDFDNKLAVIRENYFPNHKTHVKSEVKTLQETTVSEDESEVAEVHGMMKHYVQAISKTAPKA